MLYGVDLTRGDYSLWCSPSKFEVRNITYGQQATAAERALASNPLGAARDENS